MIANQFVSRVNGSQRNQTLITFDNGARWQKIQAPAIVNGVPSNCTLVRYNDYCKSMHILLIGFINLCELVICTITYVLFIRKLSLRTIFV